MGEDAQIVAMLHAIGGILPSMDGRNAHRTLHTSRRDFLPPMAYSI